MTAYQKAHANALLVQDACNFSGVLKSFAKDMEAVREHLYLTGTYSSTAFATHPVAILYMDKLIDLQRRPDGSILSAAYDQCHAVEGECKSS